MITSAPLIFLVDLLVLLALIVYKTISLKRATRRVSLSHWMHFSRFEIINSSTSTSAKAKKTQNALTVLLITLTLISAICFFIFKALF